MSKPDAATRPAGTAGALSFLMVGDRADAIRQFAGVVRLCGDQVAPLRVGNGPLRPDLSAAAAVIVDAEAVAAGLPDEFPPLRDLRKGFSEATWILAGSSAALRRASGDVASVVDFLLQIPLTAEQWRFHISRLRARLGLGNSRWGSGVSGEITDALAEITESMCGEADWRLQTDSVLARLGPALAATRAVLWESRDTPGLRHLVLRSSWRIPGMPSTGLMRWSAGSMRRWLSALCQGEIISGAQDELSAGERRVLQEHHVQSLACAPLWVDQKLWGFIQLEDAWVRRRWGAGELAAVRVATHAISSTLRYSQLRDRLDGEANKWQQELDSRTGSLITTVDRLRAEVTHRRQLEEKHLAASIRFRSIFECSTVGIITLHGDGQLGMVNPAFCALVGRTVEELSSARFSDLVHADDRRQTTDELRKVKSKSVPSIDLEQRVVRKDGQVVWARINATWVAPKAAEPGYTVLILQDITVRKTIEFERAQFQFAVDQMADAAFLVCPDFSISYVNDAACNSLGYSRDDLLTMKLPQINSAFDLERREEIWTELLEKRHLLMESAHRRKDGGEFPVEVTCNVVQMVDKYVICALARDVSQRQESQRKLQQSQRIARHIAAATPNVLYIHDFKREQLVFVNNQVTALLGYSQDELRLKSSSQLIELVHPDDRQSVIAYENHLRSATHDDVVNHEFRLRHISGQWRSVLCSTVVFARDRDFRVTHVLGTFHDITELRQTQDALRQANTEFTQVMSSIPDFLWTAEVDSRGRLCYRFCSPAVQQITGRNVEYFLRAPRSWLDIVHPDDRAGLEDRLDQLAVGGRMFSQTEYRLVTTDGSVRWVRENVRATDVPGAARRLDGVVGDITERKLAELLVIGRNRVLEQLSQGEPLHSIIATLNQMIEELIPDCIAAFRLVDEQDQTLRLIGDSRLPDCFRQAVERVQIAGNSTCCAAAAAQKEFVQVFDIWSHPDWKPFVDVAQRAQLRACASYPVLATNGEVLGTVAAYFRERHEMTESETDQLRLAAQLASIAIQRYRTMQALRDGERRLRLITDAMPALISYIDTNLRYRFNNAAYRQWFGVEPESLKGKFIAHVIGDDLFGLMRERIDRVLSGEVVEFEEDARFKYGPPRTIHGVLIPHKDENHAIPGFYTLVTDVTALKNAEQVARHSERLASLGTLAAGIAHEINNPISAALTSAVTAQNVMHDSAKLDLVRECLQTIVDSAKRCDQIVRSVLRFARKRPSSRSVLSINEVVSRAVEVVRPRARAEKVFVRASLDPSLPPVNVSPIDMEQAIVNILSNAIDASTANQVINVSTTSRGSELTVQVTDRGCGIAPDKINHIFDPFFSDRLDGEGTGVGLSIAYQVVQEHGGAIDVRSEIAKGTAISIRLPMSDIGCAQ